jgi:endoglucanase Acf2
MIENVDISNRYLEIKREHNGDYYINPIKGWSMIIKASHCVAKNNRQLKQCIKYWNKQGYFEKHEMQ